MHTPKLEEAIGAIDGVNTSFFTPTPYLAGSVRAYYNGQLLLEDCVFETNPTTGAVEFTYVEAPRVGDVLQFFYLDASDTHAGFECTELPITGTMQLELALEGIVDADVTILCELSEDTLEGTMGAEGLLYGELVGDITLIGVWEECH